MPPVNDASILVVFISDGDQAAVEQAEKVARLVGEKCLIQVVEIEQDPDMAELAGVTETPTLMRLAPDPRRRVVGDLSDVAELARYLGEPWRPSPRPV